VLVGCATAAPVSRKPARQLDRSGERVAVLNGAMALHRAPSQGLLDLFTLARQSSRLRPHPQGPGGSGSRSSVMLLHSRVARSISGL